MNEIVVGARVKTIAQIENDTTPIGSTGVIVSIAWGDCPGNTSVEVTLDTPVDGEASYFCEADNIEAIKEDTNND